MECQQKLWRSFNWKDGLFPVNLSFFPPPPFFISNLDCWLNSHQEKKMQLWCVKVGEKALHGEERQENGKSHWIWKSSILTPVTEQRRFCMRDAAGGEQIQTHVLMVSSWSHSHWLHDCWCPEDKSSIYEIETIFVTSWRHVTRVRVLTRLKCVPIPFPSFLCCQNKGKITTQ